MKKFFSVASMILSAQLLWAQYPEVIDFEKYNPPSTLVVPGAEVKRAKFPFIDVHNHQRSMDKASLDKLVQEMDKLNMGIMINLSGRGGTELKKAVDSARKYYPGRFALFTNINFQGFGTKEWETATLKQLEEDVKNGASGLKIFKNLGFSAVDVNGKRIPVNHPGLDPVWKKCGELKIPVLIHTADPPAFWQDADLNNERLLELKTHPGRKRGDDNPIPFDSLIAEQHSIFAKHPNTLFIAAHVGWYPNNLGKLSDILDRYPNVYIEFGAVIAELGRQPLTANKFFIKYQDRILFGKDSWVPEEYYTYFRVLETQDEYFPYHKKYHAFWRMYGMGLSDEILKKVYYRNALRIIPGLDKAIFEKY